MKPELSERLFIEELFANSAEKLSKKDYVLENVERLTGDASTRRYYRLFTNHESFVACLDHPTETGTNPFIRVQEFLNEYGVRVPIVHDRSVEKGYILEEDLGDVTLLQHLSTIKDKETELGIYKTIIDRILEIHKIPASEVEGSGKFELSFDEKKLNYEIDFTVDFFMNRFLKVEDDAITKEVAKLFVPICERIAKEEMVLTHRDYHSRNIMVKENDFVIIDFQDARWGLPQYDLVSMLEDCYYELDEENKKYLIQYYYDSLPSEVHKQESFENFMKLYDDMALQRVFKAVGSFSYIYETRKDVRYIKYIGFAMEKIRKILMKDEKYNELRELLFKYYYES
jgi:aminoglycoside/choline kinase family phosphotransferase